MDENRVEVEVFQKSKRGNFYCGDSYFYTETEDEFVCALADGLGSGELASESSQVVVDIIGENIHAPIEQIVKICNENLSDKRGAVLGILKLNFKKKEFSFTSIGNIGVITVKEDGKKKRNIPNAGFLAGYPRKFRVENGVLEPNMNFIMFSDGVSDSELSQGYFMSKSVKEIIATYRYKDGQIDDDITLIGMRYRG